MSRNVTPDSSRPAKERILNAATARFSKQSYDNTTLRSIAADAQVDVAYVHRTFGSKIGLFQQVLRSLVTPDDTDGIFSMPDDELLEYLACRAVTCQAKGEDGNMGAFEVAMQSLTSINARRAVLEFVENDFLQPLTRKLGHTDCSRAVLITALLAGIDLMRSTIRADSVNLIDEKWLQLSITKMIYHASALEPSPMQMEMAQSLPEGSEVVTAVPVHRKDAGRR